MNCSKKYYQVEKKEISFIRFVFEACGGIATITTIDAQNGIIFLLIPQGFESETSEVLNDLGKDITLKFLSDYHQFSKK